MGEVLPHTNAALNAASAVCLVAAWRAIRSGRVSRHRALNLAAFGLSVVFLACYLVRHTLTGTHTYPGDGWDRVLYLAILGTHVPLAALVPVLAIWTISLAVRGRLERHRRLARVTLPIWLYVSVTGVLVYWMLYHYAGVT